MPNQGVAQTPLPESRLPLDICKKLSFRFFGILLSVDAFAGLIAHGTTGLASGLAGASAFSATGYFSFLGFRNRLNHKLSPDLYFIFPDARAPTIYSYLLLYIKGKKIASIFFISSRYLCIFIAMIPDIAPIIPPNRSSKINVHSMVNDPPINENNT